MADSIKRLLKGTVISDKMDKTVVVEVKTTKKHPVLKKVIRVSRKYKVHDEHGEAHSGDVIEFYEGRPVSKDKFMYLHRIVESAANNCARA